MNPTMNRTDKTLEEIVLDLVNDNEKKLEMIGKLVKEIALLRAEAEDDKK